MNFKFGIVSEAKAGYAKVYFAEDSITTDWMPIVFPYTMTDKVSYILNTNEHVACLCDQYLEEGVILGAIHSDPEPPDDGAALGKFRKVFADGTYIEYDKNAHTLTANVQGDVNVTAKNINATAIEKISVQSPTIELKGDVNVLGILSAGALSLGTVAGASGADGKVHGDINIDGEVNASGDVKSGTISLQTHVHGGVSSGTSSTAPPTP